MLLYIVFELIINLHFVSSISSPIIRYLFPVDIVLGTNHVKYMCRSYIVLFVCFRIYSFSRLSQQKWTKNRISEQGVIIIENRKSTDGNPKRRHWKVYMESIRKWHDSVESVFIYSNRIEEEVAVKQRSMLYRCRR